MKRLIVVFVFLFIVGVMSNSFAETRGEIILKDTGYGALTGAIIGAALLVFKDDPGDHLEYISYGAASGAIIGAVYGVYEATALVEIDKNKNVKIAMPTIINEKKGKDFTSSVNILKVDY